MLQRISFLLILSFLFINAYAQNSAPGGFTYGWDTYTNDDITGLGQRPVSFDMTGLQNIVEAPATGIHPRIFFGPSEIADIKDRLENTASGQAAAAQIHAYTTLMHLGPSNYVHNSSYGSYAGDPLPETQWNTTKDSLLVNIDEQEHEFAFAEDNQGRTP